MNRRAQLICVWSGPLLTVLFIIGAVLLGRFIPPLIAPSDSAQMVAAKVADHGTRIRLGALITIISMSLVAPWGVTVAAQTRRKEGNYPILTYVQLMCVAVGTTVVVLMSMFWAIVTFRPDTYSPEFMQFANDIAYFLFLFTWPPFSVWVLAVALAVLLDDSGAPVYPRWVAYLSLWVFILFMPAGMMAFFKHGVFAWNGVMALYIPVGIFFVWLAVMTVYTIKNINAGAYHDPRTEPAANHGGTHLAVNTAR
ncbi:hypothetical protein [Mycobacterium sp.]|uniref:hypothetical protein n=1 Tax=Mycobacterium sp. TaxID=1785 RepID=UPI001224A4C2|nr:hypothetical protein [Mycobacterium sp.]TAM69787.1 MAG: hypothetical protein EPN51_08525 [Mycobacterium sp.]